MQQEKRPYSRPGFKRPQDGIKRLILNERIRANEVLVVDEKGEKLGVMPTQRAIDLAHSRELDLALVAPNGRPPVAKILDYGKYQYQEGKNARTRAKASKTSEVKGIRLGLRISEHDLEVRLSHSRKFLEKGNKVKMTLRFKGRESQHLDLAYEKFKKIATALQDVSKVEQQPLRAGQQMTMLLAPDTSGKKKAESENPEE